MSNYIIMFPLPPKLIGIVADRSGIALKQCLTMRLRRTGLRVIDFGERITNTEHHVTPLARAVASGQVQRGIAICGGDADASANKIHGVRARLISDAASAQQQLAQANLNLICLGKIANDKVFAWELIQIFLNIDAQGVARHQRRIAKLAALESYMASQPTTEATSDEEIHQSAVDNAALKIEKEQHQSGGVLDAVKALFLWVESPEERITSDQAQSPRAQS